MNEEHIADGACSAEEKLDIRPEVRDKWDKLLCLISEISGAAVILLTAENEHTAIYDNGSKHGLNEYSITPGPSSFIETIKKLRRLVRSDAFKGMISGAGLVVFPVMRPPEETFGALCMLGERDGIDDVHKRLMEQCARVISDDVAAAVCLRGLKAAGEMNERLEQEIKKSAQAFLDLFEKNPAAQIVIDIASGVIIDANPAALQFYGYGREEITGKHISLLLEDPADRFLEDLRLAYRQSANNFPSRHRLKDGSVRDVHVFGIPILIKNSMFMSLMIYDVTEKMQTENELKRSENLFRLVVEHAPEAIFVQTDYKFAYVNSKAVQLFGASSENELIGRKVIDHFEEKYRKQVRERMKTLNVKKKEVQLTEETILRLDGRPVDVEVSAAPFNYLGSDGALVYVRDITRRKRYERERLEMEAQLRQKQKLESIGTLAGGVAHEINNPINGIINYAQLILDTPLPDSGIAEYGSEIIREGKRIADIVKNLLLFARQENKTFKPENIAEIISQTLSLIQTVLRKDHIALQVNVPQDMPRVMCSSQQIQQVIMNLITNARDSLNAKYDGYNEDKVITLECSSFEKERGVWLRLKVEDRGTGITPEVMENMFDPFFTTKPNGEGTGLGLSISHGIVKDHHGELYYESEPGAYARAVLELPAE